jgi:hypothetical protein
MLACFCEFGRYQVLKELVRLTVKTTWSGVHVFTCSG